MPIPDEEMARLCRSVFGEDLGQYVSRATARAGDENNFVFEFHHILQSEPVRK